MTDEKRENYRQIFKSTSLIGGAQIVSLAIGVVRVKVLALLLGPAGVGLMGMYTSVMTLISTIFGMGVGNAGVRQVAESAACHDEARIGLTVRTVKAVVLVLGLVGTVVTALLCIPISRATFGSSIYAWGIVIVSLTVFFDNVALGQKALLQGLRRLKDLAKCTILGALFGAVAGIALVYFFREKGVVYFIVAGSAFGVLTSWWYSRKIEIRMPPLQVREMKAETTALLGLGFAFMISALLTAGSTYLIRILVVRSLGMTAVGLYTATVTLSSLYVGMVINAMGADFYPRLTGISKDHPAMNRLVNEQTEMGVLMAIPGILATLVLAPWVLCIFYSSEFVSATSIVRWQVLGVALRVVSFPMGFVILAKGMSRLFILTEFLANALQVGLIFVCMHVWGMTGLGIAFFIVYVAYTLMMTFVCWRVTGFVWSRKACVLMLAASGTIIVTGLSIYLVTGTIGLVLGLTITTVVSAVCLYQVQKLMKIDFMQYVRSHISRK